MIKNYYYAIAFFSSCMAFSQTGNVGINTENPVVTLHVEGSPSVPTKIDGIIAPRLTGDELKAKDAVYTADQTGTLVYVTAAVGTSTAKTSNVTAPGYYYFDGSIWQLVPNGNIEPWYNVATTKPATANNQDIYQMGKVGIGTATPDRKLSVVQQGSGNPFLDSFSSDLMRFESTANSSAIGHYFKTKNSSGASKEMVMGINPNSYSNNGVFGFIDTYGDDYLTIDLTSRNIYANVFGGRFGLGLINPTAKLSILSDGNTNTTKALDIANSSNTNLVTVLDNGNVGIGTATPDRKLSVVQPGSGVAYIDSFSPNLMRFESTANSSSIGHYFKTKNSSGVSKELVMGINPNSTGNNGVFAFTDGDGNDYLTIDLVTGNIASNGGVGGRFGVGTYIPPAKLSVLSDGNTSATKALDISNLNNTKLLTVLDNGNVGIGIASPTNKLEITGGTDTGLKLPTGAGAGKVLSSDASGNASWVTNVATTPSVIGTLGAGYTGNSTANQATGSSITLPPGKWSVQVNILTEFVSSVAPTFTQAIWTRMHWSDTAGGASSADILFGRNISGIHPANTQYSLVQGTTIINNTSGANKTYYLTKTNQVYYGGFSSSYNNLGGSGAGENGIIAFPTN